MMKWLTLRKSALSLMIAIAALLWSGLWISTALAQDLPATTDTAPEEVITGFTPSGLARNDTHLFVAASGYSLETCGFDPTQSTVVLQRINFNGGNSVPLLSRCSFSPSSMIADNAYVYFRDTDNKLKRIPVSGGALEILADDANTCCGLAHDETHLYWARRESGSNNNAIFRILKTGGAVEQVTSVPNGDNTYFIRDLAVDATHVYWVEGKTGIKAIEQPGVGAVRKVSKAGGALQTLADNIAGIEHPVSIALDDTHVYWSEWNTARARRVSKNGGAVTNFNNQPVNLVGGAVAVNSTDVYWVDSNVAYAGRIRRAGKGGGAVTDIAVGILGPGRPLFTDSHIYWPQFGGVYRLPLGSGAVAVDFSIDAVEVTQTIQDLNNDVPLVAEKYAFVRVYPRVDINTGQNPKVQLRGFKGGVELGGSPLPPYNQGVPIFQNGADRFQLNRTFNFKLPPAWRQGVVTLQAEINYDDAIDELNKANNSKMVVADFNHKKPLCVEMVRVQTSPQTASISDPGFHDIVDWLQASYPIPAVLIDAGGTIKEAGGSYELPDDTNKVLARIGWYRLWHEHNQWQKCGAAHFYGMVHPSEMSSGGIGYRPGWSAWGVMATDSNSQAIADVAPWYAPHGGATLAHEIAHNKGRKHVDCGGPDDIDNSYPYNPCNLGSGFPGSHMGFDYFDEAIIGGWEAGDLMSYAMSVGKPRWPSDYTYKAIYDKIPSSALMAASTNDALAQADYATAGSLSLAQDLLTAHNVLLVSALVTPTTNSAVYDQLFVVPAGTIPDSTWVDTAATTLVAANGEYTLRLLDAADGIVSELQFDLPDSDGPPGADTGGRSFVLAMPFVDQTARVVLLQDGAEVASRSASPNPPTVQVLEPNGGESYAGSLSIRWEAKDLDGDPLRFLVQYSADNGATWRVVETETFSTTLEIADVSHLPGTNGMTALVRVFANDGLHTGSDTSDRPFSLRMQPPNAHISNPSEGEIVAWGKTLDLLGDAFDVEDGRVDGSGLSWLVDSLPAGTGREVDIKGLTLGKHTVRLTAKDSGNMVDTAEHTFFVQKQYCDGNDNQLDLVFIIDNSQPMQTHAQSFCDALPGILADLNDLGLTVRHEVFDVASARSGGAVSSCATTSVQTRWRTEIDHPGDWGKAVSVVATGYPWLPDHTRLIVPVTNQGPEDGNPTADPGADRATIDRAIGDAVGAATAVSPLMMPPADSANFFINMQLAEELADATGGVVMQWANPVLEIAETLQDVQAYLGCSPEVDTVNPGVATGTQEVCLVGRHFWPGTTVSVGAAQAPVTSVHREGALLCFDLPRDVEPGRQPIRIERPGARTSAEGINIEIQDETVMFGIYLPLVTK
jgi:hypothetical protein